MHNEMGNYEKKYLLFINILIIIFVFIILYETLENNKLIIGMEISLFLFLVLVYLNILFKNSNTFFVDIRLSFILGYSSYNLYSPIVYSFSQSEVLYYGRSDIGWMFNSNDVQKSLFISILFLGGLLLALTFVKNKKINVISHNNKDLAINRNEKNNFYLWLITFIISFAWYLYPYIEIGFEVINYDRWYRYSFLFNSLKEQLGIINSTFYLLFNNYLILISLFMMFKNTIRSKDKLHKIITVAIFTFYSVFILFIDLRRRELLIVILMCISYYFFQIIYTLDNRKIKKILKKIIFSLVILLIFFMTYQQYREYFKYGYTDGISAITNMKSKQSESYKESEAYYSEFGMVYLTNLSSVKYTPELFYGKSYLEAIIKPIPFITKITYEWLGYDKDKNAVDVWLSTIYTDLFAAGGGLGFSPASEAYINFNYLGCFIIGFIIGLLLNLVYKKLYNNKYIVIYSILFSLAFLFSRTDFLGFTYEFFWLVFYYIFYSSIFKIIRCS